MARFDQLRERLASGGATVCIVGQGYVGLSLAAGAANAGMTVHGVDIDEDRVRDLGRGRLVVPGVREATFAMAVESGRLRFGTDPAVAASADVVVICVPTPVHDYRPDVSYIESAAAAVAAHLRAGTLVVLESTTYAGTTEEVLRPLLEAHGLVAGEDLLVAFSPERIDPGNPKYDLANTPRIVGGLNREAGEVAGLFYEQVVDAVHVLSSARTAELAKLLENTFRMVNIALVNELATVCEKQDIDVWEVVDAAATKPFGFMPFYPGPGVGGHCIPLDPEYLAWRSRQVTGRRFRLVELAQDINGEMPAYVASRAAEALNDHGKAVRGSKVLVLGVTYKPDVGDLRESAAIHVVRHLLDRGADVSFHDPFVDRMDDGLDLVRVDLHEQVVREADLVALLTPHSDYDIEWLVGTAPLLLDARNATGHLRLGETSPANVVVL